MTEPAAGLRRGFSRNEDPMISTQQMVKIEHGAFLEPNETTGTLLESSNSMLAAALLRLGIRLHPDHGIREYREMVKDPVTKKVREKRTVTWTFLARSDDNKHDTLELVRAWGDERWLASHPTHLLTEFHELFRIYRRMIDHVKTSVPLAMVRKNGRIALIPMDADNEERKALLDLLDK